MLNTQSYANGQITQALRISHSSKRSCLEVFNGNPFDPARPIKHLYSCLVKSSCSYSLTPTYNQSHFTVLQGYAYREQSCYKLLYKGTANEDYTWAGKRDSPGFFLSSQADGSMLVPPKLAAYTHNNTKLISYLIIFKQKSKRVIKKY